MADFESDFYATQKAGRSNPSRLAAPAVGSGTIQIAQIPYTLAETEAATETIALCLLPAGAIPIPGMSYVFIPTNAGDVLTMDIGTEDNPDGFADGITLSSVGQINFLSGTAPAWASRYEVVADSGTDDNALVYATVLAGVDFTNGTTSTLEFVLAYKLGRG